MKYYSLDNIDKYDANYNIIIGERSNGKTFACLERIVKEYFTHRKQGAIVRRFREDFRGKRGAAFFNALIEAGIIEKYSRGEWTGVYYYGGQWYFTRYYEDDKGNEKMEKSEQPFCYGFAITEMEHDKSTSYPNVTTILFDEFLARTYITDEFVLFMNCLSTIIRQRDDVKIYMCGNTVSHFSPYFNEMGIKHIKQMKRGTIDIYTYGETNLKVAVEYCATLVKSKKSNRYFAFDSPQLKMITEGAFELDIFPHLPVKYKNREIMFTYFIDYEDELFQCEIIAKEDMTFTYIHKKTTPIKEDTDLVFSPHSMNTIYRRSNILLQNDKIGQKILYYFKNNLVFFQSNEVGESITSYIDTCKKERW